MNQIIRIIFDDYINFEYAKILAKGIEKELGNIAAIEVYEEEFTDEDKEDGQEQRQGTK
jgi:hypothetical protein